MRRKYFGKNKTTETHINTIMFIQQHHLQHFFIFQQFLTWDTGEATGLYKKFQKMKQNLSKINVLFFCNFFIFCLIILIWILATLTRPPALPNSPPVHTPTKSLLFLFLQTQVITPYPHNSLKVDKCALNFSVNTTLNKVQPGWSYSL